MKVEEDRLSGSSTTGLRYLRIPPTHTPPLPSELQPQFNLQPKNEGGEKRKSRVPIRMSQKWPGSVVAEPGLQSQNHVNE